MTKACIRIGLGGYRAIRLRLDDALRFLNSLGDIRGYTVDLRETLRYLENFDEFHRVLRKRFKDYLAPLKETRDMVLGRVSVDKVRLAVEDGERTAEIVLDRRVPLEQIVVALKKTGFGEVDVVEEG